MARRQLNAVIRLFLCMSILIGVRATPISNTASQDSETRNIEETTTSSSGGTSLVVIAPSDIPVQKIPEVLKDHLNTLKERINTFEQKATQNVSSIPTVGIVTGEIAPSETGTVVHTLSSSQYIVH